MFDAFDVSALMKKSKITVPYLTAERGARVKLDGKNLGFLKRDLLSYAAEGKLRKFYPFQEIMARFANDIETGAAYLEEEKADEGDEANDDT
jgi:hypothetical protein